MFDTDMTREEAWKELFTSMDGKEEAEIEQITEEYLEVVPQIIENELAGPLCMTSYQYN